MPIFKTVKSEHPSAQSTMGYKAPRVPCRSFPKLVRGVVPGPVKIERKLNQRIDSIHLKKPLNKSLF
jgi:hypothetical protein